MSTNEPLKVFCRAPSPIVVAATLNRRRFLAASGARPPWPRGWRPAVATTTRDSSGGTTAGGADGGTAPAPPRSGGGDFDREAQPLHVGRVRR